jgi:hypothetical protein
MGKGVELRNLCCFDVPHLRHELRDAVKRLRRKPYSHKLALQPQRAENLR